MSVVLWLTIVAIGILTFAIRLSFIALSGTLHLPVAIERALQFVPVAALTAIIVPELVLPGGNLDLSLGNARLIAGIVAILVAWRTRNALLTILAGMLTLWLLRFGLHLR